MRGDFFRWSNARSSITCTTLARGESLCQKEKRFEPAHRYNRARKLRKQSRRPESFPNTCKSTSSSATTWHKNAILSRAFFIGSARRSVTRAASARVKLSWTKLYRIARQRKEGGKKIRKRKERGRVKDGHGRDGKSDFQEILFLSVTGFHLRGKWRTLERCRLTALSLCGWIDQR